MENEFKIDGELFSENENLIQDSGENTEISDVETFEGLGDILNEEEETPVEEPASKAGLSSRLASLRNRNK
jgi:hypothetical protein